MRLLWVPPSAEIITSNVWKTSSKTLKKNVSHGVHLLRDVSLSPKVYSRRTGPWLIFRSACQAIQRQYGRIPIWLSGIDRAEAQVLAIIASFLMRASPLVLWNTGSVPKWTRPNRTISGPHASPVSLSTVSTHRAVSAPAPYRRGLPARQRHTLSIYLLQSWRPSQSPLRKASTFCGTRRRSRACCKRTCERARSDLLDRTEALTMYSRASSSIIHIH